MILIKEGIYIYIFFFLIFIKEISFRIFIYTDFSLKRKSKGQNKIIKYHAEITKEIACERRHISSCHLVPPQLRLRSQATNQTNK